MNPLDLATAIRAHVDHIRRHRGDAGRALDALDALAEELAPVEGPLKVCSCGASYDAAAWAALPLVGVTDDGTERIEQRNCQGPHPLRSVCNSTLGIVVGPTAEGAPPLPPLHVRPLFPPPRPWPTGPEAAVAMVVEGLGGDPADEPMVREALGAQPSRPEEACARQIAPPQTPVDVPAGPPLCEAPGCGRPLSPAQLSRGARACSPACRRAACRARERAKRLAALDAASAAIAEARREITGG